MSLPDPQQLRVGILTVSDTGSRGEREDKSGDILETWCAEDRHRVVKRDIVPDQTEAIVPLLIRWADGGDVDMVITTGGTGFGPRDVTPEATQAVLDREAPGLAEAIRRLGGEKTPYASLSRGLAGSRGAVFFVNLPGSPGGVRDGVKVLGPLVRHLVGLASGIDTPHQQS